MRIGLSSIEVAGFRGGGIGTYVVEAGRALGEAGHEVWLFTPAPDKPAERDALRDHDAFARVVFTDEGVPPGDLLRYSICTEPFGHSAHLHGAILATGVDFDYLEFPDYGAEGYVSVREQHLFRTLGDDTAVAVVLHSPTLECYHYNEQDHAIVPRLREVIALEDDAIRSAPLLWCPSTRLGDMVAARLALPRERIATVRLPLTLGAAPPPPAPGRPLAALRFLHFGRLEPRKGLAQLFAAFGQMPELQLDVVGVDGHASPWSTSYRAYLEPRRPANVRVHDPLPRDELQRRIAESDVCVFAAPWDNWPNTCLEAMAQARVVLGSHGSGMAEMIEPGRSGFLFHGDRPEDLVRVVRQELGTALDRLDSIGAAAAARARALSDPAAYAARIEALVQAHRDRDRPQRPPRSDTKVSVVMPYYNESPDVVGAAVDSTLAQTHQDLELLLVDDGSPRPDAGDTLAELARRDPRVRVLRKANNGGLASARNHAIGHAQGAVVLCLDADNLAEPDYAATAVQVLAEHPDSAALSVQARVRDGDRALGVINALPYDPALALLGNQFGDAGAAFRREVFALHGLAYDPRVDLYCDWALWLDLAARGLRVEVVPRVLYHYRVRPDSMMQSDARARHLALVGLLIEHHLDATAQEKRRLVTQLHAWGLGALAYAFSPPALARRPALAQFRTLLQDQGGGEDQPFAQPFAQPLRHRAADAVARGLGGIPVLAPLFCRGLEGVLRLHGRLKDRRRG